ncbi:MAG: hypothetical protein ABFD83_02545 [Armatimonadota bacterium]
MKMYGFKLALVLIVALAIAGCGGGGGGGSTTPLTGNPGVTLTIGADTAIGSTTAESRAETTINAKLDAGATIQVYNFATGELLPNTGTIDSNGFGTVNVTSGLSVVVVITGKIGDKNYRMSTIIPTVPQGNATYVADAATTLASEAISEAHYKTGTVIDSDTFDAVKAEAESYLAAHSDADVSLGGGLISGETFGAKGNLDSEKLAGLIAKGAEKIYNALVKAKNAVQQMKEVAMPWATLLNEESPNLKSVYNACASAIDYAPLDEVAEKYEQLGSRMSKLLMPAFFGELYTSDYDYDSKSITDLEMGKGYQATLHEEAWGWSWIEITKNPAYDATGRITIKLTDSGVTYTVVATQPTSTTWQVVQTSSNDGTMYYKVVGLDESILDVTNPSANVSVSIKDSKITTPITFSGVVSATGANKSAYTAIQFNGTLTSAEVNAKGNFVANFLSAVPSGAQKDTTIYDYPTSLAMSGASCTVTGGSITASLSGDFSETMQVVTINGYAQSIPKTISLSGASISASSGTKSVELKGNISATVSSSVTDDGDILPTGLNATGLSLTIKNGTQTVGVSGGLTATAQIKTGSKGNAAVPDYVKLSGGYNNSDTKLDFSGTIEGKCDNPTADASVNTAQGSVTIVGEITRDSYRAYEANLEFNLDGGGNATCTVNKLGWGTAYLTGSGSTQIDSGGDAKNPTLELTNQDGVKFTIGAGLVGEVTVDAAKVADISKENGMLKITFTDDTHEYLPE